LAFSPFNRAAPRPKKKQHDFLVSLSGFATCAARLSIFKPSWPSGELRLYTQDTQSSGRPQFVGIPFGQATLIERVCCCQTQIFENRLVLIITLRKSATRVDALCKSKIANALKLL
jgi:hypothetical protein